MNVLYTVVVLGVLLFGSCAAVSCDPDDPDAVAAYTTKAEKTAAGGYSSWGELDIDITTQCYDAWYSGLRELFKKGQPKVCELKSCEEVEVMIDMYGQDLCDNHHVCRGIHQVFREQLDVDFNALICAFYHVQQGKPLTCGATLGATLPYSNITLLTSVLLAFLGFLLQ